jgi:hypothetical protein
MAYFVCEQMVDDWNAKEFSIQGTNEKLTIIPFEKGLAWCIKSTFLTGLTFSTNTSNANHNQYINV